jgi:spermidine synthase
MDKRFPIGDWVAVAILFACFFLSGAAALMYEVVWMRMLTQIFGSTAYAIATVLAGFMAGLALGSFVFGRIADRREDSLRLYAWLELGIGVYGAAVPLVFKLAWHLYRPLFPLHDSYPTLFHLVLFGIAFVFLVIPTFLMGATLPLLSRYLVRSFGHLGRRVGDLYGTNTLGAVAGCGLAGYYFLPELGITRTLFAAAGINAAVAAVVFALEALRRSRAWSQPKPVETAEAEPSAGGATWLGIAVLAAIGFSGAAAMIYENAWTHALTLVIGGSVYSFTTMLLSFLVGLAVGGYLYARLFGEGRVRVAAFGLLEIAVGAAALATIPLIEKLPLFFLRLYQGFGDQFGYFLAIQVCVAFLVMFPATLLFGMTFPMVVRLCTQNLYQVGSKVGTTYAVNTLGAIVGAFVGGFVLLPQVGIQRSIIVGAFLNLIVGWLLVVGDPRPGRLGRLASGAAVSAALLWLALHLPSWDRHILTSGVTIYAQRYKELPTDSLRLEEMRQDEILYYREGLTATVSVHRPSRDYLYFKTNGKVDGSYGDQLTMLLTGYLPMFLHPRATDVGIIGLGTGMTAKAVGAFPVRRIDILEIEPAVVEAAKFFKEKNGDILSDPRVRVIASDGRNYMLATPHLYDLIISEPSNPWIAGIANLFTKEFYEVAKGKLKPGGVFAQWIHNYSMSPDDFRMVFRTFAESFPHVSVWNMQESDFLLIGTLGEQRFDYSSLKEIFAKSPTMRADFAALGLADLYAALGFYRMGRKEALAFAEGAEFNTDDNVRLEFSAPRSLAKSTSELNRSLMEGFMVAAPWAADGSGLSAARRHFLIGQAYRASGDQARALKEIGRAIELEPENLDYRLERARILTGQDRPAEALPDVEKLLANPAYHREVLALTQEFYTSQAEPIYLRLAKAGSREILVFLGLANIALYRNRLDEAERWNRNAAAIDPEHPGALGVAGRLALARGENAEAAKLLEAALAAGEESGLHHAALGEAYTELRQWDKAIWAFERALRKSRRNVTWRLSLAHALVEAGRLEQAERRYREVLALDPNRAEAWRGLRRLGKRY